MGSNYDNLVNDFQMHFSYEFEKGFDEANLHWNLIMVDVMDLLKKSYDAIKKTTQLKKKLKKF